MVLLKKYKRFKKYPLKNIKKIQKLFDFFLISESSCYFTEDQFNCMKKFITKYLKSFKNCFFFNVKPFFFLTSKPSESRMGGGKGSLNLKIFYLRQGQIFLSFKNIPFLQLFNLINKLSFKVSHKFKLVKSKF